MNVILQVTILKRKYIQCNIWIGVQPFFVCVWNKINLHNFIEFWMLKRSITSVLCIRTKSNHVYIIYIYQGCIFKEISIKTIRTIRHETYLRNQTLLLEFLLDFEAIFHSMQISPYFLTHTHTHMHTHTHRLSVE